MVVVHISWFCAPRVRQMCATNHRLKIAISGKTFVLLSAPGFDWTCRKDFHPPCPSPYSRADLRFSYFPRACGKSSFMGWIHVFPFFMFTISPSKFADEYFFRSCLALLFCGYVCMGSSDRCEPTQRGKGGAAHPPLRPPALFSVLKTIL